MLIFSCTSIPYPLNSLHPSNSRSKQNRAVVAEETSSCSRSDGGGIRVLNTAVVTPAAPPPPPCSLQLTYLDMQWIHSPPVERLFFQPTPDTDLISRLKDSLSTLRLFFPLAGRLRAATATTRHHVLYQPGDGVAFTLAEYDADLSDLASDHRPRKVSELAHLAVQATVLLRGDRPGLALGVTVHHVACDGAGSTNFLHAWAAACAGPGAHDEFFPALQPPVIDRTLIAEPQGLYDHYARNLLSTDEIEFVKMSPDQVLATFTLSVEHLQGVKDAVAGEAVRRGQTPPPRCSTLVATLGFMWSCYCRAQATDSAGGGPAEAEPAYFIVPVDQRQWMKPPVPAAYLGHCIGPGIGPGIGAAPKKELASGGAGGLLAACEAIEAGVEKAVASPEWETLMERIKEVGARGVLSVAGSPRFRLYDVDFGFGRPVKVEIVSVARTGAMAVAEGRSRAGMEVGISLPPAGMEAFQRCFADTIAWLSSSR